MPSLDDLDPRYRLILCDIWGVVHDGGALLPGAVDRLLRFKREGRSVVLITNAPRSADTVASGLDRLGLPRAAYDAITSSGEAGIAALTSPPRPVGFLGTSDDRADLVSRGVIVIDSGFTEIVCTGTSKRSDQPSDYFARLEALASAGVTFHCLNPDRVVIRSGVREACAGALADLYEQLGGKVVWYGKPHAPIYDHALLLGGNPPRNAVLAIGDALHTDILGAARYGIDAVYVSHGIHDGEPIPTGFAALHGLGDWHPILTVANLL
ncbi:MAG: TIGR01459 family HAD-type hydrolase [Sphingomonas sp.]|uniref:TIGR01459 family HAD-type hydrolase n=1 Tax=Sphingomonas sp. TaxID=28214 RepID=UPI001849A1C0|nr:TIGR01459 family HAD-type hydrolase [Sphingomonas sp.]MBA3666147.1 TIGR01459 family HAD-type hydrolase [Sphingomonas sp.]